MQLNMSFNGYRTLLHTAAQNLLQQRCTADWRFCQPTHRWPSFRANEHVAPAGLHPWPWKRSWRKTNLVSKRQAARQWKTERRII